MPGPARFFLLVAAAVLALAACGGNGDGDDSGSGGSSESPATTILADAGLEVCSEAEEQVVQSTVGPGVLAARAFAVAEDCGGSERSPDMIRVFQFGNRDALDAGAAKASDAYPNGVVLVSGALVIVVTGPNREANADAVGNAYEESTGEPVRTV
jgi:ABC-type Fe3+-hydroxamate transport system substrate-binding protein